MIADKRNKIHNKFKCLLCDNLLIIDKNNCSSNISLKCTCNGFYVINNILFIYFIKTVTFSVGIYCIIYCFDKTDYPESTKTIKIKKLNSIEGFSKQEFIQYKDKLLKLQNIL